MDRIDKALIADAIMTALGWARVDITAPSTWIREDAAYELGQVILERIQAPTDAMIDGQIGLGL